MALRGLTVSPRGVLLLDGVRFRNIGMNYIGGVARIYTQPSTTVCTYAPSAERSADMAAMAAMGVKVVRVATFPYWPSHWASAVLGGKAWNVATSADRVAHYAEVDDVIAKAKAAGIGVILTFAFRMQTISDVCGETPRAWLNSGSNTRTFANTMIDEWVTRYKDESAVYGWEFSNEVNHRNDQPDPLGDYPVRNASYGTRTDYVAATSMFNGSEFASILSYFSARIQAIDPQRLIMSGNGPNSYYGPNAISFPIRNWITEMARDNPMNSRSMHFYGGIPYCSPDHRGFGSLLTAARYFAQENGQAFVLGEFGNQPFVGANITAVGTTVSVASTAPYSVVVGEVIEVRGADQVAYNGIYPIASLSADRKTFTYIASTAPGATATGDIAIQQRDRFSRQIEDVIYSGVDLALVWQFSDDPNVAHLESVNDPFNAWQIPLIASANARLAT